MRARMASGSKFTLVMVAKRFWVIRWFVRRETAAPSARSLTATAARPFVTYTSRSCRAAVSGVLPQTPARVQPLQPAVSWH